MSIKFVKKRDGRVVAFNQETITTAIWRAAKAVGGKDKTLAIEIARKVVHELENKFPEKHVPTVEEVQDSVEKVLIEEGHARTAKAYIIYRQAHAEIRREKAIVLDKNEIDEVDKRFDLNALRVLKSRYLRKDENGKTIESPKELFTRIAVHVTLPELLYDTRVFDLEGKQKNHPIEPFDNVANEYKLSIGKYQLNQYHLEALKRMFDKFSSKGRLKYPWNQFLAMLKAGEFDSHEATCDQFYHIMVNKKFMPNTPAIANFGAVLGMGSACFVMDVRDNIEGIMDTLKNATVVFKSGGGVGYNFSKLRPEGDFVSTTTGAASGPISFMGLFDKMTEVIKQGGIRRGANMGILNSNHPDIEKFITAKEGNKQLTNFNISVLMMPDFWEYYNKNEPYPLINPRNGEIVRTVNPRMLFDMVVYQAWESAEPGVIFYDRVNEHNPFFEHLGPIVTTNPCGEVLLYPNESCNLGSINVWNFFREDENGNQYFDWNDFEYTIHIATKLLDNVIDVNKFPLKSIEDMADATRKIGLGVMGVADLLYELKMPYNAPEARDAMEKLMEFLNYHSKLESIELAKTRGPMPYNHKSFYTEGRLPISGPDHQDKCHLNWDIVREGFKTHGARNGYNTVIAPTGSISMIAGCSSGIEPVYALVFEKNVKVGSFYYTDPVFERIMKQEGLHDSKLMEDVTENGGSIQHIPYLTGEQKRVFVTAMDINPEDHIRMLATFQKWTDSSISKTNNFPADATVEDMRESYLLAYELGCKDVTVYRDSSIKSQVLNAPKKKETTTPGQNQLKIEASKAQTMQAIQPAPHVAPAPKPSPNPVAGQRMQTVQNLSKFEIKSCPNCNSDTQIKEGCVMCPECGWGMCS